MPKSVIITCAPTGGIHTPTMSPHLPITPAEIARASIEAHEAGASIIHLHARHPETGKPDPRPELFQQFLPIIKQSTDAVINVSTGGGLGMTMDERLLAATTTSPEMASLNMGSMNFGIFPMLQKYTEFQHDWERPFLEMTEDFIFPIRSRRSAMPSRSWAANMVPSSSLNAMIWGISITSNGLLIRG